MSVNAEQASAAAAAAAPPPPPPTAVPDSSYQNSRGPDTRDIQIELEKLDKDNAGLKHELIKAQNTINSYSLELNKTKQKLAHAEQAAQRAQSHSQNFYSIQNDFSKLESLYSQTAERLRATENQIRSGAGQRRRAEEEARMNMQALYAENEILTEKLKDQEAYAKQLLLNMMKDGRWNPAPDNTLRDRLDRLHSDTKDWAKKWAHEHFSLSHLTAEKAAEVRKYFSKFVRCEEDGSLPAAVESPSSKMKARIPSLLLTAALARVLEVEFFANSFFCADPQRVNMMRDTYSELVEANYQQAHIWRSTFWRILNPPQTSSTTDHERTVWQETSRRVRSLCDHINTDFLSGPSNILLAPIGETPKHERAKSLRDILLQAADVATSLWTQRSYLASMSMHDFTEARTTFNVTSPLMMAHPLNKVDTEDVSHNGREILVVTRPTILAYDEHDNKGMKGEQFRVLARAIVWLEEPKKSTFFRS